MNEQEKTYKVYKIISPSGKIYIGITSQTLRRRFMNGYGYKDCPAIYKAIQKYGWANMRHEILFSGLTKKEAEGKEIELIAYYKSNNKRYGYNIENGGNVPGTHSEETKRKISEKNKGRTFSQESLDKMKEAHKGTNQGNKNPFFGKKHSEETKKNHSAFMVGNKYNLGNHHTDEFKKMKSLQMSEKYSNGGNPRCKKVLHFDKNGNLIKTFFSLREAARFKNVSPATMLKFVNNKDCEVWKYEK